MDDITALTACWLRFEGSETEPNATTGLITGSRTSTGARFYSGDQSHVVHYSRHYTPT